MLAQDFAPGQLPQGEKGDTGLKGDKGDTGLTGETGSPGLSGYQTEFGPGSAVDSTTPKSDTVPCPAGKKAISGAATVFGAVAAVPLVAQNDSQPAFDGTTWTVKAIEAEATTGNWGVQAVAVCATVAP